MKIKTRYELAKPVIKQYVKENPWILQYENAPRFTKPSISQDRINKCFERYFNVEFKSCYLDWNRNHVTGLRLELDGYNEELKIAFEFNGTFYHYSSDIKFKDECKRMNCEDNNVKLYCINEQVINPSKIKDDEELYLLISDFIKNN